MYNNKRTPNCVYRSATGCIYHGNTGRQPMRTYIPVDISQLENARTGGGHPFANYPIQNGGLGSRPMAQGQVLLNMDSMPMISQLDRDRMGMQVPMYNVFPFLHNPFVQNGAIRSIAPAKPGQQLHPDDDSDDQKNQDTPAYPLSYNTRAKTPDTKDVPSENNEENPTNNNQVPVNVSDDTKQSNDPNQDKQDRKTLYTLQNEPGLNGDQQKPTKNTDSNNPNLQINTVYTYPNGQTIPNGLQPIQSGLVPQNGYTFNPNNLQGDGKLPNETPQSSYTSVNVPLQNEPIQKTNKQPSNIQTIYSYENIPNLEEKLQQTKELQSFLDANKPNIEGKTVYSYNVGNPISSSPNLGTKTVYTYVQNAPQDQPSLESTRDHPNKEPNKDQTSLNLNPMYVNMQPNQASYPDNQINVVTNPLPELHAQKTFGQQPVFGSKRTTIYSQNTPKKNLDIYTIPNQPKSEHYIPEFPKSVQIQTYPNQPQMIYTYPQEDAKAQTQPLDMQSFPSKMEHIFLQKDPEILQKPIEIQQGLLETSQKPAEVIHENELPVNGIKYTQSTTIDNEENSRPEVQKVNSDSQTLLVQNSYNSERPMYNAVPDIPKLNQEPIDISVQVPVSDSNMVNIPNNPILPEVQVTTGTQQVNNSPFQTTESHVSEPVVVLQTVPQLTTEHIGRTTPLVTVVPSNLSQTTEMLLETKSAPEIPVSDYPVGEHQTKSPYAYHNGQQSLDDILQQAMNIHINSNPICNNYESVMEKFLFETITFLTKLKFCDCAKNSMSVFFKNMMGSC